MLNAAWFVYILLQVHNLRMCVCACWGGGGGGGGGGAGRRGPAVDERMVSHYSQHFCFPLAVRSDS